MTRKKKTVLILNACSERLYSQLIVLLTRFAVMAGWGDDPSIVHLVGLLSVQPSDNALFVLKNWFASDVVTWFVRHAVGEDVIPVFVPPDPKFADPAVAIAAHDLLREHISRPLLLVRVSGTAPVAIIDPENMRGIISPENRFMGADDGKKDPELHVG